MAIPRSALSRALGRQRCRRCRHPDHRCRSGGRKRAVRGPRPSRPVIGGVPSLPPESGAGHPHRLGVPCGRRHHPHCGNIPHVPQRWIAGRDRCDPYLPQRRPPSGDRRPMALATSRYVAATGRGIVSPLTRRAQHCVEHGTRHALHLLVRAPLDHVRVLIKTRIRCVAAPRVKLGTRHHCYSPRNRARRASRSAFSV